MDAEGARAIELLEMLIAALEEGRRNLLVLEGLSAGAVDDAVVAGDSERRENAGARRSTTAQQGASARYDNYVAAGSEHADSLCACADDLEVRLGVRPRQVQALGQDEDMLAADIGGDVARKALRRLVAAHHDEHGTRIARERRGHEEGAHGCHETDARVLPRLELGRHRLHGL